MDRVLRDDERTFGTRLFRVALSLTTELPSNESISACHCLGFDELGRFLLTRHVDRQWTIPGGHREPGESAEAAMRREALEEAAAIVSDPELIAVERIDLLDGTPDSRYPDPAFQVFFITRVVELGVLVPNAECTESRMFEIHEARAKPGWIDHNGELFDAAVAAWQSRQ